MNKKQTAMISILMAGTVLLAGCQKVPKQDSTPTKPIDDVAALGEFLPAGAELLTPKKAEKKQSIYMEDLNKDGNQEAFLLYRDPKDNRQAHMMFLVKENGAWQKKADMETGFTDIDTFDLVDLDGNGTQEVTVGGGLSVSSHDNQLYIYELQNGTLEKKADLSYDTLQISDFNDDQMPDLMIISKKESEMQTAGLYSYADGSLRSISEIDLDPEGTLEHVAFGTLADGKKALFADSGIGAHSMLTEIIVYENGNLKKVGNPSDSILMKPYPLYSRDINGDGIVEVGGMYSPKGYEDAAMADIPFLYTYKDYHSDGSFQTVEERYSDSGRHFYITIPTELHENVTIKRLDNGIHLISTVGDKVLFEVKWAQKDAVPANGTLLGTTKDMAFYSEWKEETKIPASAFHLMEEEIN
ncbi:hypothetical protein [Lacrimispora sp.]|jgi:hypothetical protein|uniref:hypothetical protein n=1 Tax=Lacrimispora sp. TaxID=2719234 RepID=UPI0028A04990|nr:hypothetical protein [Lacrimispora sp.]